jgi:hypothetical protein
MLLLFTGANSQAREADCEPANRACVTTTRRYCLPQLIAQTGKSLLFIRASTPDSAFQACIDQFKIKDGNRLRNSGSLVRSQPGSPTQSEKSRACSERTMPGPSRRLLCPSDARDRRGKPIRPNRSDRLSVAKVGWSNNEAGDVLFDGRAFLS